MGTESDRSGVPPYIAIVVRPRMIRRPNMNSHVKHASLVPTPKRAARLQAANSTRMVKNLLYTDVKAVFSFKPANRTC